MGQIKTRRPFEQRFLDGFDRSRIRQEVLRAKRKDFLSLRKRYATMALGASLALSGIGIPWKMQQKLESPAPPAASTALTQSGGIDEQLGADLKAAGEIAEQVTTGVAEGVSQALSAPAKAPAQEVAKSFEAVAETAREQFFKKEVPFGSLIYSEAKKNNLDPELVAAVVQTESRFKPTARSHAGAQGLMQLVPRTGRWMGAKNLMNPTENVKAGTKYLAYLNDQFNGDEKKMIAAYNAGEGNVRRFGGVPPFRETQNYVRKVASARKDFKERYTGQVAELVDAAGNRSLQQAVVLK